MRNSASYLLAIGLCLGLGWQAVAEASPLPSLNERLLLAVQAMQAREPGERTGKLEDLELFVLGETAESLEQRDHAQSFRQYLRDFLTDSPLLPLLPEPDYEVSDLSMFDPKQDYSRLIKSVYAYISRNPYISPDDPELSALAALLEEIVRDTVTRVDTNAYWRFLQDYPDSLVAGWAVYQLAWDNWLQREGDAGALAGFGMRHPDHPLSREARSTLDIPYFNPRQLAQLSSVLPGLGEETLEPGMRESSTTLYSELLYLAGTIGFAVAAQSGYRPENLAGALIFANLLILNHRGSADKAYYLALRRNQAEYRKFMLAHLEDPITGPGKFPAPAPAFAPAPLPLADEFIFSLVYQFRSVGDSLQGQGLVEERDLGNLGFRAEYLRSLIEFQSEGPVTTGIGLAPFGRVFFNHVRPVSETLYPGGLRVQELEAGLEAAWITRLQVGSNWFQLRLSGGPSWRDRRWTLTGDHFQEQGLAYALSGGLAWGGMSGVYWQVHVFYSAAAQKNTARLESREISVPTESLGVQFGLGVRF